MLFHEICQTTGTGDGVITKLSIALVRVRGTSAFNEFTMCTECEIGVCKIALAVYELTLTIPAASLPLPFMISATMRPSECQSVELAKILQVSYVP